jgi:hypothetical protein
MTRPATRSARLFTNRENQPVRYTWKSCKRRVIRTRRSEPDRSASVNSPYEPPLPGRRERRVYAGRCRHVHPQGDGRAGVVRRGHRRAGLVSEDTMSFEVEVTRAAAPRCRSDRPSGTLGVIA